jgi:hypothetical protein
VDSSPPRGLFHIMYWIARTYSRDQADVPAAELDGAAHPAGSDLAGLAADHEGVDGAKDGAVRVANTAGASTRRRRLF